MSRQQRRKVTRLAFSQYKSNPCSSSPRFYNAKSPDRGGTESNAIGVLRWRFQEGKSGVNCRFCVDKFAEIGHLRNGKIT